MNTVLSIEYPEFDYQSLLYCLRYLKYPRDKISDLLKSNKLIRVKKGLYVFPDAKYSKEVLANLIYGPSFISLHYALMKYGLIPEQVVLLTSVTIRKNKYIKTPLGDFSYLHQNPKFYFPGQTIITENGRNILIAFPEKAIADILYYERVHFTSYTELAEFLFENMRIEKEDLRNLDMKRLFDILSCHSGQYMLNLNKYLKKLTAYGTGNN